MRPGWDEYFLGIAATVATRADCTRRQVGAVIVDQDHRIVSTGYNGAPPGRVGCLDGGCPRGKLSEAELPAYTSYDDGPGMCIALHAELNAVVWAGRAACSGATLYITDDPCEGCKKVIRAADIARVITPMLRWQIHPRVMHEDS